MRQTKPIYGENFAKFDFDENPLDKSDGSSLMSESEVSSVESGESD